MAVATDPALPAAFSRLTNSLRRRNVVKRMDALHHALQNYPLQRLQEQARGKAIESDRVAVLETRATRAVLAEMRELGKIADSIPDRDDRPAVFLEVLPILSRALAFGNGEWSVRQATVRLLGTVWGDDHVVPLLEYIMTDSRTPVVCRAAAVELAGVGSIEAVEVLARALAHEDEVVRNIAIDTLQNKHLRRYAVPALEKTLRHRDPRVRRRAADVLDYIEWRPSAPEFNGWYTVAKQDWNRAADLDTLAVPALENALRGSISQIRRQAAAVLDTLDWDPSPFAVRGWYLVAKQEWDEAMQLRLGAGLPLVNCLLDSDHVVCENGRQYLKQLGIDAVPALVTALHDSENAALVRIASNLLGSIAKEMPDREKAQIAEKFIDAVTYLAAGIAHPHRPMIIEPALTLADIAENIPRREDVCRLFDPVMGTLTYLADTQYGIMRQNLDSVRHRIHRAQTGTQARPVPSFITFVWRKGTVRHKILK